MGHWPQIKVGGNLAIEEESLALTIGTLNIGNGWDPFHGKKCDNLHGTAQLCCKIWFSQGSLRIKKNKIGLCCVVLRRSLLVGMLSLYCEIEGSKLLGDNRTCKFHKTYYLFFLACQDTEKCSIRTVEQCTSMESAKRVQNDKPQMRASDKELDGGCSVSP